MDQHETHDDTLRLWMVRHGQTLFNELGLAQGWCDSPLTDEGRRGVTALADELREIEWSGVYASSSERAVDTAEMLLEGRMPVVRDWRWKEFNFGVWEARPNVEMIEALRSLTDSADPLVAMRGLLRGDHPALERGESGAQYASRVNAAIADIRARHRSGDVLVVTHGMTIGVAAALADPDFDFGHGQGNATFSLVEYAADGSASIRAHGASSRSVLSIVR
ncbi:histidine phosphatase family protein [Microbacterium sp.]|uniref:histidine phosphatase family protein n=1 Tax=Microbacterium sp. TaxID=51671 RepID=UPI0032219779